MVIAMVIIEVIVSLALTLVILFQSGKESGLSGALAGGTDTYMSKNKGATMDQKLASLTKWIALAWVVVTLVLVLVIA